MILNDFEIKFVNNDIVIVRLDYNSVDSMVNDFRKSNFGFLKIKGTSGYSYYNINHIVKIKMLNT